MIDSSVSEGADFEVRKLYNDVNFIDEFFTEDFVVGEILHVRANRRTGDLQIASREFQQIKQKLLHQLQRRAAVYLRRGRQLPQPRRAARTPSRGRGPQAELRA